VDLKTLLKRPSTAAGRFFSEQDSPLNPHVAIIRETLGMA
jgi:hypothetical protein